MKTDNKNRLAPSLGVRLLCWFGVYIAALIVTLIQFPWLDLAYSFPGCLYAISAFVDHAQWLGHHLGFPFLFWTGYGVYALHLIVSLCVRSSKTFFILLSVLILIATLNAVAVLAIIRHI